MIKENSRRDEEKHC
uniref:Uncharacterized protein n=1 Tax=Anguilla anguilla TaxID=7936 RepID=A0A0E9PMC6_ANGAN